MGANSLGNLVSSTQTSQQAYSNGEHMNSDCHILSQQIMYVSGLVHRCGGVGAAAAPAASMAGAGVRDRERAGCCGATAGAARR